MMSNKLVIPLLISLGLLTSCEYTYHYSYTVTNSTDTTISIHIKTYKADSVYTLPKDIKKTIYMTDHGIEGSKGPYFKDVNKDLNIFMVMKGQLNSRRNYLTNESWTFDKGNYRTTIINSDF